MPADAGAGIGSDDLRAREVKGRMVGTALLKSGTQVLLVGGTSAAIGWLIGAFIPELF